MCTGVRFTDSKGHMYFGRNLDWTVGFGEEVFITQRGFSHPALMDGKLVAKYASMGMSIDPDGCPLYLDAMNEKGLGVAGLNFPGYAKYSDVEVEGKTNIPAYAFPYFIASQFASVDEAEEALKDVVILNKQFNDQYEVALLHWLIGDKDRSIVVEYTEDGMHVYHNDLDVLANQPTYPFHHENVRNYMACTPESPAPVKWAEDTLTPYGSGAGMRGIPGDYYSPSRFVRAAYLNAHYQEQDGEKDNVTRLFKTLEGVAMIKAGAKMPEGDFEYTLYSACFSAATNTYYYTLYDDPQIRAYKMDAVDLDGGKLVKAPQSA